MSGFTPNSKHAFDFEGDRVEVVFRRIKRKDIQKWAKYLKVDGGKVAMTFADQVEMGDVLCGLLPDYIVSMSGLRDADGGEVTLQQAIEEAYFLKLVEQILGKLFEISHLKDDDAKNSVGPSADTLKG